MARSGSKRAGPRATREEAHRDLAILRADDESRLEETYDSRLKYTQMGGGSFDRAQHRKAINDFIATHPYRIVEDDTNLRPVGG